MQKGLTSAGQLRRRIARCLLGAPLSAWLGAPRALAAPPVAPNDAPPESKPLPATGWVHAYAAFGEPKYPRGFDHFEYLEPTAPKGGVLYLPNPDRRTSFDKYNIFTIKGNAPAGVAIYMVETLAVLSADENQTIYGLLAEEMLVAPDKSSITFRLHPKARFTNGDPVTSEDVRYSLSLIHISEPTRPY